MHEPSGIELGTSFYCLRCSSHFENWITLGVSVHTSNGALTFAKLRLKLDDALERRKRIRENNREGEIKKKEIVVLKKKRKKKRVTIYTAMIM